MTNTKAYVYILGANSNPNNIECSVPAKVNKEEIFFGPCKIKIRTELRKYIGSKIDEDIYIIGLNRLDNTKCKIRKIIWAGKLKEVMTFETAYNKFISDNKYNDIFYNEMSPMHVEPHYEANFVGYKKRGNLHDDCWVNDLISHHNKQYTKHINNIIKVKKGKSQKDVLDRDCCFLLENIFFANGKRKGIDINPEIIKVLKKAQNNNEIDKLAIFGRSKNGTVNGKRGSYLEINGALAKELISLIIDNKDGELDITENSVLKQSSKKSTGKSVCRC